MYEFAQELSQMYDPEPKHMPQKTETPFYTSLSKNLEYIKTELESAQDLTIHELDLRGIKAAVISIDNMISKDMLALSILRPLYDFHFDGDPLRSVRNIEYKILYTDDISEIKSFEELFEFIMSGFAVIAVEGSSIMLSIGIQGYKTRSISEPESDVIQRGSREGFVEPLRTNITLLRRRLKTTRLKFEIMKAGTVSNTEICICYLKDIVSDQILAEVKERIKKTDIETVLAAGYLVPYLEDERSLFRGVGITERPDTLCGKMTEGRIGILIDGVPSALIVPFLFNEYFQTIDDYSNRPFFAFFTRLLKFTAFFISIFLPGLYTSLGTFDPELFPTLTLNKIAVSIADTPLSLMAETLLILLVYEVMRESGLRMPQPLGYAVSIVGGLVIGDTAINAGLIGAPTLMVVAASAICSYIIPNLYAPAAVLRIAFTIAGGIAGMWGIAALSCAVFIALCGKTSFGVPYTSPITPLGISVFRDVFVRADWKTLSKNKEAVQNMPGSEIKGELR